MLGLSTGAFAFAVGTRHVLDVLSVVRTVSEPIGTLLRPVKGWSIPAFIITDIAYTTLLLL